MKKLILVLVTLLSACYIFCFTSCKGKEGQNVYDGTVVNTVVYVNFKDAEIFPENQAVERVNELNLSPTGMTEFFKAESLGKCNVTSVYAGSVTLDREENYYRQKRTFTNPDGYSSDKNSIDAFYREQMLVREAVGKLSFSNGEQTLDANGDGYADGITFVINSDFSDTSQDILWPHKSEFYEFTDGIKQSFDIPEGYFGENNPEELFIIPEICGVKAGSYTVVSSDYSVGEICHEFSHVLGLPDYYSYVSSIGGKYDNIGGYDLMGASVKEIPQYSLAYVRAKLGWLNETENIKVTDKSSSFSLAPVTENGVQAVKIIPADFHEKGEFFMVEARRKEEGRFDSAIDSTGIIIYSVKEENAYIDSSGEYCSTDYGNMYGNGRFEVKLFFNKDAPVPVNYFKGKEGYNSLKNIQFTDGESAGVSVENIVENADGTFSFDVNYSKDVRAEAFLPQLKLIAKKHIVSLNWEPEEEGLTHIMAIKASGPSAAGFSMNMLPNAKQVAEGDGGGFEVVFSTTVSSASRRFLPRTNDELYFVVVSQTDGGELYGYQTLHVGVAGANAVDFSFTDVIKVVLMPGKPAFIACCALLGLCVLVGILVCVVSVVKRKKSNSPPVNM